MGTIYIDTGGATTNSGTSDNNSPDLSGTGDAVVTGSVVQLTVGTDLSGVVTAAGSTQSAIYIAQATNSNQKIFWITAKDDVLDQVTVSVAPTGVTASNWAIGGRMVYTAANFEAAVRPADIIQFNNSPASKTADFLTARLSGTSADGFIKVVGKTGTRPVLTITNTTQCIENPGVWNLWWVENLELVQQGASGNVTGTMGRGWVFYNVKVSDGGGFGIDLADNGGRVLASEITGTGGGGVEMGSNGSLFRGNYVHDLTGVGISYASGNMYSTAEFNIVDTCTAQGIYISGTSTLTTHGWSIIQNVVFGCGNTGLEITDADSQVNLLGNIFQDNGNAAGEFNVEWVAGSAEKTAYHSHNWFYHQGGGGGANLSGLTANATEGTTDPLFTSPSTGDFTLQSTSPCKATSYPGAFLGGPTGYLDMGAVQRAEPAAGGGGSVFGAIGGVIA